MTVQGTWSMAETGSAKRTAKPRSYWLAGSVLLLLVAVILSGAFLLDRQFRPRVGIETATGGSPGAVTAPGRTISTEAEIAQLATPLEREVATAYLRYWALYSTAMETLDSSRLVEVATGERLSQAVAEVEDLRADGIAAKIQVKHNFQVLKATEREAAVRDEYINSSYAVDPQTRKPVGDPGQSQRFVNTYSLERVGSAWKVVDVVRDYAS